MRKLSKARLKYTENRINIQNFVVIIMPSLTKKTILTGVKFYKMLAYIQVNVL